MVTVLARKLWSVAEYERMIETGILDKDDRVELIHGEIVEMAPIGVRHAACVTRLEELFHELLSRSVTISVQNPVQFPNNSEPEPDVAILKRRDDHYAGKRPTQDDVLLLIEVSDTTLATDRREKVPLYAEAGIGEVWLVNLDENKIEIYSTPLESRYLEVRHAVPGEQVVLPNPLRGNVSVAEVLGKV